MTDTIEFAENAAPETTWGEVTSTLILEFDWAQGPHAADPSGDGNGYEDRSGLANIFGQGDMQATTDFIADFFGI